MIDITVGNNLVKIKNKIYHSFNDKQVLANMIIDIIDRAKYSGENMILSMEMNNETKIYIKEW